MRQPKDESPEECQGSTSELTVQTLHSVAYSCSMMRTKGLGPRHVSHTMGVLESHPLVSLSILWAHMTPMPLSRSPTPFENRHN